MPYSCSLNLIDKNGQGMPSLKVKSFLASQKGEVKVASFPEDLHSAQI